MTTDPTPKNNREDEDIIRRELTEDGDPCPSCGKAVWFSAGLSAWFHVDTDHVCGLLGRGQPRPTPEPVPELGPRWRKAIFYICDNDREFVGYHCGHRWNGWACPMFPIESVREIADWMDEMHADARIEIDEKAGTVTFTEDDWSGVVERETRERNGIPTMALYTIGDGWCWDVTELNSEDDGEDDTECLDAWNAQDDREPRA